MKHFFILQALCLLAMTISAQALPLKIVAFGDSTTAPRSGVTVYSELLAEDLRSATAGVIIINKGVPGNTTTMAAERFSRDVLAENPALVVIQFGINDSMFDVWKNPPATSARVSLADYEKNLRHFISEVRKIGATPVLMTPNQLRWTEELRKLYAKPPYDSTRERGLSTSLSEYADAVRKIAHEQNVPLIDIYSLYDEWETNNATSCAALLSDGMHPNSQGQALVAQSLTPAVIKLLPKIHTQD